MDDHVSKIIAQRLEFFELLKICFRLVMELLHDHRISDAQNEILAIDRLTEEAIGPGADPFDAAEKLTEMVTVLLDIGRLESGDMPLHLESCDSCEIVQEALHLMDQRQHKVQITLDLPSEPVQVKCDRELTRRVITNLVGNAVNFSRQDSEVAVRVNRLENGMRVDVIDSGPGIPKEFREKIFEKFSQVVDAPRIHDSHSVGLGLTFCKLAVEAHGGHIGVESEVGRGSTFHFTLAT